MLKIQSLRIKNIFFFIFCLLGLSLPLLFMNCSLDEGGLLNRNSVDDPKDYTENTPRIPGPDGPDADKVVWPNGVNVGEWKRTSQISSLDIRTNSGQVSITHTKAGQWNPTESVGSASVEDPVEGNAWILVPIKGKSYAAPYDWMGKADPDHMLDVGDLDGFYQQLPPRAGIPELRNWVPLPGDRIGFMVSGFAKNNLRNVEERSNMLVVRLPDKEGKVVIEVCSQDEETTENTNIPTCRGTCGIPNRITIIDSLARQNSEAFNKAHVLNAEKISNGSVENDDERWEFMDRVVETLRSTDDGFGYTCVNQNCEDISTSKLAYKCKTETAEDTTSSTTSSISTSTATTNNNPLPDVGGGIGTVDILKSDGSTQWELSDPDTDPQDGWTYPRPGADPENPETLVSPPTPGGGVSTPPTDESGESGECSGDSNAPDSHLDIVKKVATKTGNLYKTSPDQFTQHVVECLKDVDSKWGRRNNSNGFLSKDVVAYQIEGSEVPYSIDIIVNAGGSNPTLAWNVQRHNGQCGQTGGRWQEITGDCIVELEGHCTEAQRDSGDYETVDGKCYPTCESFEDSNAPGVEIGTGDECEENESYNILPIENTVEEKKESTKCCRKSSKGICHPGYGLHNGNCHPQCATAAKLAGYTNYFKYDNGCTGLGNIIGILCTEDCDDLNENGHSNWKDFNFYDPYKFSSSNNIDNIDEVLLDSDKNGCCVTGNPTSAPTKAYGSDGWHESDHERVGSSSSSTGGGNGGNNSGGNSGNNGGNNNECTSELNCGHLACGGEGSFEVFCINGQCQCGT